MLVREAIILAAGEGSRLRMYINIPKPFAPLGKFRLLHFPLLSLYMVGVRNFVVVSREGAKGYLSRILKSLEREINYRIIINKDPDRENGYSLYLGIRNCGSDLFFVSMSDHIYPPSIPSKLLRDMDEDIDILVAADSSPKYADINEATKIYSSDGRVLAIGKGLRKFNYVDAGLFIMRKNVIRVIEPLLKRHEIIRVSDIVNEAIRRGYNVRVSDITGSPWIDIDTPRELTNVMYGDASELIDQIIRQVGGPVWR